MILLGIVVIIIIATPTGEELLILATRAEIYKFSDDTSDTTTSIADAVIDLTYEQQRS